MNRIPVFIKWLVGTVLALTVLTGAFFVRGQQQPDQVDLIPQSGNSELNSLLIQLANDEKETLGLALLVKEKNSGLKVFNISPRVAVAFGEAGVMTAAQAGTQVPPDVIANGLSSAIGIKIDGTLTLQRLALAGLVDSLGGIEVNPQAGLLVSSLDQDALYVAPGRQKLDGQYAAGYALTKQFIEDDASQFVRINEVLRAVFNNIPIDDSQLDETLAALGSLARSDVSTTEISEFFVSLNQLNMWPAANYLTVITDSSELELMPDSDWLRVRQPDNWNLVARTAPKSVLIYRQNTLRVEVSSESPIDRLVVADELAQLGLEFIDGGYVETPEVTSIRIGAGTNMALIEELRNRLGLQDVPIEWDFELGEYSDAKVVIGVDYRDRDQNLESVN